MPRTLLFALLCVACLGMAEPADAPRSTSSDSTRPEPSSRPSDVQPSEQPAQPPAGQPTAPELLDRVALLGASATAGFNVSVGVDVDGATYPMPVDFGDVLTCTRLDGSAPASEAASFLFFTNPLPMGSMFAQRTLEARPTLVIAVDYLFWFGYGLVEGEEIAARLALLDQGLAHLDRLACPIIVGDFPDMSEAIGQMLVKQQVPSPEALRALNDRLRAWAAERPRVRLFGLAAFVQDVRTRQPIRIGEHTWAADRVESLLQPDKLHPSLDGMVAMALQVAALASAMQDEGRASVDFVADPVRIRSCVEAAATAKARERQARRAQPRDAQPKDARPKDLK